jgi:hypothetical protein
VDATEREQVEVLRRIAERGLKKAQDGSAIDCFNHNWSEEPAEDVHAGYIDLFQHLLDEIERLK